MALLSTVLGKLVFDLTGSELALGLLGLAEFAPAALLVFVTGPLADRVDRRRLAAIALTGEAVTVIGLAVYVATDPTVDPPDLPARDRLRHRPGVRHAGDALAARRHRHPDPAPLAHRPPGRHLAGRARPGSGARRLPLRGRSVGAVRGGRHARRRVGGDHRVRQGARDDERGARRRQRRRHRAREGATEPARGGRGSPLRAQPADPARRDLPRPVRGALRRCGRAAARDRGGPSRRRVPSASDGCGRRPASVPARSRCSSPCAR